MLTTEQLDTAKIIVARTTECGDSSMTVNDDAEVTSRLDGLDFNGQDRDVTNADLPNKLAKTLTCLLVGLRRSLLACIQALMSLTYAVNLLMSAAVLLTAMLMYTSLYAMEDHNRFYKTANKM